MRPGGKSNGESPFFETPNLSFEGRIGILALQSRRCITRMLTRMVPHMDAHAGGSGLRVVSSGVHAVPFAYYIRGGASLY